MLGRLPDVGILAFAVELGGVLQTLDVDVAANVGDDLLAADDCASSVVSPPLCKVVALPEVRWVLRWVTPSPSSLLRPALALAVKPKFTPRLWKIHFASNPLRSDLYDFTKRGNYAAG